MSSPARRAIKRAEFVAQCEADEAERIRKANRSMWERIYEADASDDVKDILHAIIEHIRMD